MHFTTILNNLKNKLKKTQRDSQLEKGSGQQEKKKWTLSDGEEGTFSPLSKGLPAVQEPWV